MRSAKLSRSGTIGLSLAAGVILLATGGMVTAAAYSDQANMNLGAEGIGFPYRFDIALVSADGTVRQADTPQGVDWEVPGADDLVPGHSVTTTIPVFNNTPTLSSDTSFEVVLRNTDGTVAAGIPNITPHLRFTAEVDGTALFTDVTWDQARGELGVLAPRGSDALAGGDAYSAGPAGTERELTLTVTYVDEAGVELLNGGQSALAVRFDGESVTP